MERLHGQQDPPEIALELSPEACSVTRARQRTVDAAATWGLPQPTVERLALLVTELASNAVVHARSGFRVGLSHDDAMIRGTVSDADPHPPLERDPPPRATAGRGLMLVRRLADRSGVQLTDSGKSVWFELDTPG